VVFFLHYPIKLQKNVWLKIWGKKGKGVSLPQKVFNNCGCVGEPLWLSGT
jgi:hypothetical protein